MEYLLDTDVFIQAKKPDYGVDLCPAFCLWIDAGAVSGAVLSIDRVREELISGDETRSVGRRRATKRSLVRPDARVIASLREARAHEVGARRLMYHIRVVPFGVDRSAVVARIGELLDVVDGGTVGRSMRLPPSLREAASLAVDELDAARSTTALAADALRSRLEAIVMQEALDAHYAAHPSARPSLADLAMAAAELDGHPLAGSPDGLRRAAEAVVRRRPSADAEDVLLWAEATASASR